MVVYFLEYKSLNFSSLLSTSYYEVLTLTCYWNGQNPSWFQTLSSNWPLPLSSEYLLTILGVSS